MTELDPEEEIFKRNKREAQQKTNRRLIGCLISLATLGFAFFFILEICARH